MVGVVQTPLLPLPHTASQESKQAMDGRGILESRVHCRILEDSFAPLPLPSSPPPPPPPLPSPPLPKLTSLNRLWMGVALESTTCPCSLRGAWGQFSLLFTRSILAVSFVLVACSAS